MKLWKFRKIIFLLPSFLFPLFPLSPSFSLPPSLSFLFSSLLPQSDVQRDRENDPPFSDLTPQMAQQLGMGQAEVKNQELHVRLLNRCYLDHLSAFPRLWTGIREPVQVLQNVGIACWANLSWKLVGWDLGLRKKWFDWAYYANLGGSHFSEKLLDSFAFWRGIWGLCLVSWSRQAYIWCVFGYVPLLCTRVCKCICLTWNCACWVLGIQHGLLVSEIKGHEASEATWIWKHGCPLMWKAICGIESKSDRGRCSWEALLTSLWDLEGTQVATSLDNPC